MQIRYIEHGTNIFLGSVNKAGIKETLLPKFIKGEHKVFINKHFINAPDFVTWEIIDIEKLGEIVHIFLRPEMNATLSYGTFARSQSKSSTSFYIKRHSIVDVDYSHHSVLDDFSGTSSSNEKYASASMYGELHKKRPCIVLSADSSWGVSQVLPLTTRDSAANDSRCILISATSFNHLAPRYRAKPSYAMMDMIQSVSSFRIHPPEAKESRLNTHLHSQSIQQQDKDAIEMALSCHFSKTIASRYQVLENSISKAAAEKKKIMQSNREHQTTINGMKELIRKMGNEAFCIDSSGDDFNALVDKIKDQLQS